MFSKQTFDNIQLTAQEVQRYTPHIFLPEIGGAGQQKLKKAKILIVGAGGLGAPVLSYLCASGIGTIGILDFDKVELSNLQRQIIHNTKNIGKNKTTSAAQNLRALNPNVILNKHLIKLNEKNAKSIFKKYDIIIDCCDNFNTRYLICDTACLLHKPCITGAISMYAGQITVLKPYENNNPSYRDLFPYSDGLKNLKNCNTEGVLATLPGVIGSLQATEAIKLVVNIGIPLIKKLLIYNALQANFNIINY